jgi:hypothetical protein
MKFVITGNVGNSRGKSKYFELILAKGMLMFLNILGIQCHICAKYFKMIVS